MALSDGIGFKEADISHSLNFGFAERFIGLE
jgi:hypothetical protein